ncbi:MAG: hypothetical protein RL762_1628, partial [Bacteroidota bacterium]
MLQLLVYLKKKAPHYCEAFKIGIDLLSHDQNRSTISASR